jgi:hypothetical protein
MRARRERRCRQRHVRDQGQHNVTQPVLGHRRVQPNARKRESGPSGPSVVFVFAEHEGVERYGASQAGRGSGGQAVQANLIRSGHVDGPMAGIQRVNLAGIWIEDRGAHGLVVAPERIRRDGQDQKCGQTKRPRDSEGTPAYACRDVSRVQLRRLNRVRRITQVPYSPEFSSRLLPPEFCPRTPGRPEPRTVSHTLHTRRAIAGPLQGHWLQGHLRHPAGAPPCLAYP